MRWIAAVYASLRALMIASFAGTGVQAQDIADADDAAWAAAQQIGTPDAYQRYLQEFPVGRHVEEAFRSLIEEQVEGQAGLTRGGLAVDMY